MTLVVGSELPPGALEDIIKKGWEAVDNLIVLYKKKCEAAGVNSCKILTFHCIISWLLLFQSMTFLVAKEELYF